MTYYIAQCGENKQLDFKAIIHHEKLFCFITLHRSLIRNYCGIALNLSAAVLFVAGGLPYPIQKFGVFGLPTDRPRSKQKSLSRYHLLWYITCCSGGSLESARWSNFYLWLPKTQEMFLLKTPLHYVISCTHDSLGTIINGLGPLKTKSGGEFPVRHFLHT